MQVTYVSNNLARKHLQMSIETHFEFFEIFSVFNIKPKYSYMIMYECKKSQLTHELSYIGLFNFSHLNLFHVNIIYKKIALRNL